VNSTGGTIDANGHNLTYSGAIVDGTGSPAGALTIKDSVGAGSVTLAGANTYSGGTVLMSTLKVGTDTIGTPGSITSSALGTGILTFDGGTLQAGGAFTIANAAKINQTGATMDSNGMSFVYSGNIGDGSGTPAGSLTIANSTGSGIVTLSGANTYSGATTVGSGAVLAAGSTTGFSSNSDFTVVGSLSLHGFDNTIRSLSGAGNVGNGAAGTATLTIGIPSASATFSGSLSDGGAGSAFALAKTGAGTQILSGNNNYSGATTINGGTLQAGSTTAFSASSAFTVGGSASLDLNGFAQNIGSLAGSGGVALGGTTLTTGNDGTSTLFSGTISATGGLAKTGAGTFTLGGTSSYSGGTSVSGGTLRAGAANSFAPISAFTLSGGSLDLNGFDQKIGSLTGSGNVTLGSATLTTGNDGTSTSFSGAISGTGGLTKIGTGIFTLSGTSGYGGATTVSAGLLRANGSLTNSAVTVETGATLGGSGSIAGAVTIQNGGHLAPGSGSPGTLTVGSLALSSGSILDYELGIPGNFTNGVSDRVDVTGKLTLAGTLNVTDAGSFGSGVYRLFTYGSLVDNGLALGTIPGGVSMSDLSIQTSVPHQVNLINAAGLTLNFWDGGDPAKFNNSVVDGGNGVWSAVGDTWTDQSGIVNHVMTPQPAFAVFQGAPGVVTVDASQGDISVTGMQFATDGYSIVGDPITLALPKTTIRVGDGTQGGAAFGATIGSSLTGPGGLVKTDLGTLTLTGANSYTGGTFVNGGTLAISSDANLGAASGGLSFDGGTLRALASLSSARLVTLNSGGGRLDSNGFDVTLSGPIGGAGGLFKSGAGVLTLSGTNSYSGGTTILGGVLALAADANLGATSGGLTIDGSTLRAIGSFSSARSVTFASGGATIDTGGSALKAVEPTAIVGGVTLALTGPITGIGGLTLIGSGTLVLSNSSYSGPTSLLAAGVTLKGGATNGFSANSAVTVGAGTFLDLGGFDQAIGSLAGAGTVSNSGAGKAMLSVGVNNASTLFSGVIKDDGPTGLVKTGTGTLTLTGASTYTGGTVISAGTLQLGNGGTSGSISGNVADNGVLAFDRSDSATFAVAISGTGSVQQIGTGKTILTGASTYTGATIVSAGTWQGGAVNSFAPMSAFTIAGGALLDLGGFNETIGSLAGAGTVSNSGNGQATLTVGGNNASTLFSGVIKDDGATGLVKIGAGTLTLTGLNTYSGATTVAGGVLDIEGSIANSAVTVASGATIAGKGTLGSLIVPAGAIAAPGAVTPFTTLNVAKDATFAAGSTFLVNVDAAGRNDKLSVGGKASLQGGTVQVKLAPGIYLPGSPYALLAANGGVAGTFANLATSTDLAFLTPMLSYDGNDAFFGFVRTVTTSGDVVTFPRSL
jgi:fibronectin-binding autotransporter adhesin